MPLDAKRVQAVFLAVIECADADQRAAALDRECGADAELRRRVVALLEAHDQSVELPPVAEQPLDGTTDLSSQYSSGKVIAGRYKLLEQIGEGGMGAVWVAEQAEPVRRRVALKLIKPGMDSKQVLSRFAAERQALALMDHPNIAKVFDGGMTEEGRPFFVMEYVKGVPITDYCDQARLSIEERLKLFLPICQAVQHAHQKGVIHRDLKPSNLLVCLYDGQPVPKIIDFGLAKAISQPLTEHTLYTAHGLMVGTPLYMSPEQAEFNNLDVDTRTDIYSLGVILYELLTGTTPLEKQKFKDAAFQEILRLIKEEEPPKPSTKLSGSASLPAIAAQRRLEAAQLSRLVRGELDWIVMKALEKERSRRYETANGLTRDLERYLNDEPVEACPPSLSYRASKFARRNLRALITASLFSFVVVAALVAVAASIGWAVRDRQTREAVVERKILLALDKAEAAYRQDKLDEAQAAVHQAEGLLASAEPRPEVVERYRRWLAGLAMVDQLEQIHTEKALVVKDEHFDDTGAASAYSKAFDDYGLDLNQMSPLEAAQRLQAAPIKKQLLAALQDWAWISDEPQRSRLLELARQSDVDPWRQRLQQSLEDGNVAELKDLAADDAWVSQSVVSLALLARELIEHQEWAAAVSLLRNAQARHPNDFWTNEHLGCLLLRDHEADEAAIHLRSASAQAPQSPVARNNLGVALAFSHKRAEALDEFRAAIRLKPDFAMPHHNIGSVLALQNDLADAEAEYREAARLRPMDGQMLAALAGCLAAQGKYNDAEKTLQDALAQRPDDWQINEDYIDLLDRAGRLGPKMQDVRRQTSAASSDWRQHRLLGDLLQRMEDLEGADSAYRQALRLEPRDARALAKLGLVLILREKPIEAVAVLREAVESQPELAAAQMYLGAALSKLGRWADGETPLRKAVELRPGYAPSYSLLVTNLRNQYKNVDIPSRLTPFQGFGRGALTGAFELGTLVQSSSWITAGELALMRSTTPGSIASSRNTSSAEEGQLRSAIASNPQNMAARERLGAMLIGQGDGTAAYAEMWEAICIDPTNARFHEYLGESWGGSQTYAEAAFRESIRLEPGFAHAHGMLARCLMRQGRRTEAVAAAREAVRLEPQSPGYHQILGRCQAEEGELEEAASAFRVALRLDPQSPNVQCELGWVLRRTGITSEAESLFQLARQARLPQPFHIYNGTTFAANGLYWQAAQHFQAAVEENPEDSSSALRAAFLLLWLDDRAGYEKYCRLLLEQFSNSTDILHTRRTVQACLITPETIGDLAVHERLAYSAADASQNATVLRERALLAYRRGAWDAALSWARKSRDEAAEQAAAPADGSRTEPVNPTLCMAQNYVLESMAYHQLGQTIEARRAYEMAARLGQGSRPFASHHPGSTWVDWLTFEINRQEAAKLLAIQDDSGWPLAPGHARTLAAAGDWKAAASELARACTSPAATSIEFVAAGTALARAEDREGYRRHCQAMIERFRAADLWNDIERTVKVCALAPYDVEIPADMLRAVSQRMEEGTLEAWEVPWGNTARAQAAYRKSRFDDAAKWADAAAHANETAANRYARIQGFLIAAMAHHRRGDAAAAKDRLATALETRNQLALPKLPNGSFDERLLVLEYHSWWDVLAVDLMLREAKNLVEGAKSETLSASSQIAKGSLYPLANRNRNPKGPDPATPRFQTAAPTESMSVWRRRRLY